MAHQTSGLPASAEYTDDPSTRDVAREQAGEVGRTAREGGRRVADTATEQAGQVGQEARRQARDLYGQAREQVTEQARNGQQQASDGLRSLSRELAEMADGGQQQGPASDLAKQAADRLGEFAEWLNRREPADLVDEFRALARRRPGAFLLGAAVAGVLAGRLTRGAVDANRSTDDRAFSGYSPSASVPPTTDYRAAPPAAYPPVPPRTPETGWVAPEPGPAPRHAPPPPVPSGYPADGPDRPLFDDPGVAPRTYPTGTPELDDQRPTPPSGTRTVDEYVEDRYRRDERPDTGELR